MRDPGEREEAVLKVSRQEGTVSQVFDRLSLGVQQPLYLLDDVAAMREEELEKFDVCLKRHLAGTRSALHSPVLSHKSSEIFTVLQ